MRWTVVIPVKALPAAKSRLATGLHRLIGPDAARVHAELVAAMRTDTVAAARSAPGVARVLIVADRPGALRALGPAFVQAGTGLNPALVQAWRRTRHRWPQDGTAVLVGDLPALRPVDLAAALAQAAGHRRSTVPDAAGTGTTLLAVRPGTALHPHFGPGSARWHRAGGSVLRAGARLRADVDSVEDLTAVLALSGPATRRAAGPLLWSRSVHPGGG